MVDWSLARQIARYAAGNPPPAEIGADLSALSAESADHVAGYTRLEPPTPLPQAETLDRPAWADVNLDTLASLLDPVATRLEGRMSGAGALAGPLRIVAGATLAAEAGLVIGYMSQRVLGQYELSLLQPEVEPRLLFVAPNLARASEQLGVEREGFLRWVTLHELTHVFQFSGVPWLREHLGGLLRQYLDTVEVRIDRGAAGGLPSLPDPRKLVEEFREGGLAALVQSHEQRAIMDKVQAAMAVIEGYSEHVMDAVGAEVLPDLDSLRSAMERRRRSRSAVERILMRLLGLDAKMRQYEDGKRFCDAVVDEAGIEGLNRVWIEPAALPDLGEIERPRDWLARVERGATPAAV